MAGNHDVAPGPPLPSDIFDLIVDELDDKPDELRVCCLVSKSWVPRTRRHLFATLKLDLNSRTSVHRWKEIFPDPSTAPTQYTRSLKLFGLTPVIAENALAWTRSFRHLVELRLCTSALDDDDISLTQLSGFSPTLKSLFLLLATSLPLSDILSLICSFPLLENLYFYHVSGKRDDEAWTIPSTSPKLTGTLELTGYNFSIVRGLLAFPNGLNFSKIAVALHIRDAQSTMELISKCSDTLESLSIGYLDDRQALAPPLDLSKFLNLQHASFLVLDESIKWVTTTLQNSIPPNLRKITVNLQGGSSDPTEQMVWERHALDCLLTKLRASHSVLPKVVHRKRLESFMPRLFPELIRSGADFEASAL